MIKKYSGKAEETSKRHKKRLKNTEKAIDKKMPKNL